MTHKHNKKLIMMLKSALKKKKKSKEQQEQDSENIQSSTFLKMTQKFCKSIHISLREAYNEPF